LTAVPKSAQPWVDTLMRTNFDQPTEQTDEWTEARRYTGLDILAKARLRVIPGDTPPHEQRPDSLTA
jgi:hypothetical protein